MKILSNLKADAADADDSRHPIRQAVRAGVHTAPSRGVWRFIGFFDQELHLHHGRKMVVIPFDELWKLAEAIEPEFLNGMPPAGTPVPPRPIAPVPVVKVPAEKQ